MIERLIKKIRGKMILKQIKYNKKVHLFCVEKKTKDLFMMNLYLDFVVDHVIIYLIRP
jgi:hypothetical protein